MAPVRHAATLMHILFARLALGRIRVGRLSAEVWPGQS